MSSNDQVGDAVGVLLIDITSLPDTAGELNTRALLDGVGRLVGRGVQVRLAAIGGVGSEGVGLRANRVAGPRGDASYVRGDIGNVVSAKRILDLVGVRLPRAGAGDAASGMVVNACVVGLRSVAGAPLYGVKVGSLNVHILADIVRRLRLHNCSRRCCCRYPRELVGEIRCDRLRRTV